MNKIISAQVLMKFGSKHSDETRRKLRESHLGIIPSQETRLRMSESGIGRTVSVETRKKISESRKALLASRPDLLRAMSQKGKKRSAESCLKIGASKVGRVVSEETKAKLRRALKGKQNTLGLKLSIQVRRNMSECRLGSKAPNWQGGKTKETARIRGSIEYRLWRDAVYARDNYTCVFCGARNGNGKRVNLNADHIKPFSLYPELRFAIDNGRTLCEPCHRTTDTFGFKALTHRVEQTQN